jgi:4-hydroxy-2-oxoheptanedioate aldolase
MATIARPNRVRQKLLAGQTATVVGGHVNTAGMVDFLGPLGFDGFWLEGEHGPVDWSAIGDLSRACDLWGMAPIMRVHANEPGLIGRVLDRGANGIVVPHVNTRAEAERVVQAARFHPQGRRGIYGGRRAFGDPDYWQHANDDTLVVVLIEEMQAVENLSEILSVEHIDVFFVAPGDLSQSMGRPMQMDHPEVVALVNDAIRQIVAAGRVAGALAYEHRLADYLRLGARFLLATYASWIVSGARAYLGSVDRLFQAPAQAAVPAACD